jgi:hypothetical protein
MVLLVWDETGQKSLGMPRTRPAAPNATVSGELIKQKKGQNLDMTRPDISMTSQHDTLVPQRYLPLQQPQ